MSAPRKITPAERIARSNRRAEYMRQVKQWHWISGAISLIGMLLFAITGITLNHASLITATPAVTTKEAKIPDAILATLKADTETKKAPLPAALAQWAKSEMQLNVSGQVAEWSRDEIYISLPRPGGDGWLSIDRSTGEARSERTDRGWIAFANDLHKGRHAGNVWGIFIDVFAVACIVFCVTGLLLLQLFAKGRSSTWPLVGLGFVVPLLIAVFLIH
jgi:hypothetical protein